MTRIGVVLAAAVLLLPGCAREVGGLAVAGNTRPQDVWQLADDLAARSPVTAETLSTILGVPVKSNGRGSYRGGPADLGPQLTVSSVTMLDIPAVTAILIEVQTPECITLDEVKSHHPGVVKRASVISGGTVTEQWADEHSWGQLGFAVQQPPGCLQRIDVGYPKVNR